MCVCMCVYCSIQVAVTEKMKIMTNRCFAVSSLCAYAASFESVVGVYCTRDVIQGNSVMHSPVMST